MANTPDPKGSGEPPTAGHVSTGILRSIGEGIRTIVTVTERLTELRTEIIALRTDLTRLVENVSRIAGRLDGIDQRFTDVDKRFELAVKLAVRDEVDRTSKPTSPRTRRLSLPARGRRKPKTEG